MFAARQAAAVVRRAYKKQHNAPNHNANDIT